MGKKIIISIIGLLFILNTYGQTLYVNNSYTGEEQTGSVDQPFRTIQQAVDAALPGNTILIKAGMYREEVEIATDSIIIRNYEKDKVIVSGAEPVLEWEQLMGEVYWAIVPWKITENDESDQVFVDGKMLHLTRWPKETSHNFVTEPTMAVVDDAENSGSNAVMITDEEFNEPAMRWLNGLIWINLSNDHDGQGWSGKVGFISTSMSSILAKPTGSSGIHASDGHDPWAIQKGSKYYLFNPTANGVYATGGPQAMLARGEWWRNEDTLFVRLPNGERPALSAENNHLVEVKKRLWAFIPKVDDYMHHVTIKGLHLFASSITTDRNYTRATISKNSYNNTIDSINARYITHFIDQSGHYQSQWYARTGIILSGINHTLKNSIIKYSAGAAVSAFGEKHKIIGNSIYEVNYQVTEAGAINSGKDVKLYDPEIAYNFFHNIPQKTINIGKMYSSDPETPGLIHIHHNVIMNFMLRNSDSGAMNGSAGRNWDLMRIDHNIIANANNFLAIGIYTDYGGQAIFDHNLIWNVDRPIQMNRYNEDHPAPVGSSDDGPLGEIWVYNNTVIADKWNKAGIYNNHVNPSGEGIHYKNNIISNRIEATLELAELESNLYIKEKDIDDLFVDFKNHHFMLRSDAVAAIDKGVDIGPFSDSVYNGVPDIGAFEYGIQPWKAGPEGVITGIDIIPDTITEIYQQDTVFFQARALTNGIFEMDPQPKFKWWTDESGRIDQNGMYIADSIDKDANIYITVDSLIISSTSFGIKQMVTSNDVLKEVPGTQYNQNIDFTIFPNPAKDQINIAIDNKNRFSSMNIEIYNLLGNRIININKHMDKSTNIVLNTLCLKEGIYIIRLRNGSFTGNSIFTIEK